MSNKLVITKETDCQFLLKFSITNNNIRLPKLINENILNLLYELNRDIVVHYSSTHQKTIQGDESDVVINLVQLIFIHLFKDIGIPQFFLNLNITMKKTSRRKLYYV